MPNNYEKGRIGEDLAGRYLESRGFKVLEHGFRCKIGEIDIIAEKKGELYFIEVKARWQRGFGDPMESINARKQRRVVNAARFYLAKNRKKDAVCHLSAIGIDMSEDEPAVEFIGDAFES